MEKTPFHIIIARWVSMIREGSNNVQDEPLPGRPISTTFEKDISTVKAIVDEVAMEEISDISGLSVSNLFSILKEKLKIKKVCARWILHSSSSD
jgi:hypothetical protein